MSSHPNPHNHREDPKWHPYKRHPATPAPPAHDELPSLASLKLLDVSSPPDDHRREAGSAQMTSLSASQQAPIFNLSHLRPHARELPKSGHPGSEYGAVAYGQSHHHQGLPLLPQAPTSLSATRATGLVQVMPTSSQQPYQHQHQHQHQQSHAELPQHIQAPASPTASHPASHVQRPPTSSQQPLPLPQDHHYHHHGLRQHLVAPDHQGVAAPTSSTIQHEAQGVIPPMPRPQGHIAEDSALVQLLEDGWKECHNTSASVRVRRHWSDRQWAWVNAVRKIQSKPLDDYGLKYFVLCLNRVPDGLKMDLGKLMLGYTWEEKAPKDYKRRSPRQRAILENFYKENPGMGGKTSLDDLVKALNSQKGEVPQTVNTCLEWAHKRRQQEKNSRAIAEAAAGPPDPGQ